MAFTDSQIKLLEAKLSSKHVKVRMGGSKELSYIEGWHAIAEANRIFGFDGWDREMIESNCIWSGAIQGLKSCSYSCRVRISVHGGDMEVTREGTGFGHATGGSLGESHERALKAAETDATKRALATFGNPFGLALYDEKKAGVTGKKPKPKSGVNGHASWMVKSEGGTVIADHADPKDFCTEIRETLASLEAADQVMAFWKLNQDMVGELRKSVPGLISDKGRHYGEILGALYTERLQAFAEIKKIDDHQAEPMSLNGDDSGRSALAKEPPRIRDKEHLKEVASQPCLICGRSPSHAHHIRFAQTRAMSKKVGDQWTVPLCATHHRALHDAGDERGWWERQKIDPIENAKLIWLERHGGHKNGYGLAQRAEEVSSGQDI
jgi:DNA recombination protein Rad52